MDLALRACAAWQRFELEEIALFYAPDVEVVSRWADLLGRTFHGHDGLRRWMEDFTGAFEKPLLEFEAVGAVGGQVVVIEHVRTRGRQSGAEVDFKLANVFTIRDGLIARQVVYDDLAEARAAAGLP